VQPKRSTPHRDQSAKGWRPVTLSTVVVPVVATAVLSLAIGAAAQTAPSSSPLMLQLLVGGRVRCDSPGGTCAVVNLYGQDGDPDTSPMHPGDRFTTTVELRNGSDRDVTDLDLSPGPCRTEALNGATATADLCTTVTVAVACDLGGTSIAFGPETLLRFAQVGGGRAATGLAAGDSATCGFAVTYPADAPPVTEAVRAVQPVTWTLVAEEPPTPSPSPSVAVSPSAVERADGLLPVTGGDVRLLVLSGLALAVAGRVVERRRRPAPTTGPAPGTPPRR
jgi:hypothetical protein